MNQLRRNWWCAAVPLYVIGLWVIPAFAQQKVPQGKPPMTDDSAAAKKQLPAQDPNTLPAQQASTTKGKPTPGPTLHLGGIDFNALVEGQSAKRRTYQQSESASVVVENKKTNQPATDNSEADSNRSVDKDTFSISSVVDSVTLGGYGQHEFISGENEVSAFRNHRFVLFLSSQMSKRVSMATEIEWEWAGTPMKKEGQLGVGEVLLEYAIVDIMITQWLVLRGGVILVPELFNINHDAPLRQLVDRPIALTTIIPTTWFESGIGFHGMFPLGKTQQMGYELYVVNGLDSRIYDGLGFRGARGSHFEDNNNNKALTGRLFWKPTMTFELGVFGYSGKYDLQNNRANIGAIDLTARYKQLEFQGEIIYAWIDAGFVEGFSASSPANTRDPVPESMFGFFGQVNYHFQIDALNRAMPEDFSDSHFVLSLRYEGKDTNRAIHTATGDKRRLTFGMNFRPITKLVFKFNFQWNTSGTDHENPAAELWNGDFWKDRTAGFLFDRFVASIAYTF